jgi:SAM-dependent methyltransferase
MIRSLERELMDSDSISPKLLDRFHRDLALIHRLLGSFPTLERFLRADPLPVRKVLDIGCGGGDLLVYLRKRMGVEVVGIDLKPGRMLDVPLHVADATQDLLPEADVAVSSLLAHHLSPEENIAMIRNVGRSCRRFVIQDLIRHPLPLALFSVFLGPLISREAAADGRLSVRRAYTPEEFRAMAIEALDGRGSVEIDVSPFLSRQVVDIRFTPGA